MKIHHDLADAGIVTLVSLY